MMEDEVKELKEIQQREDDELDLKEKELDRQIKEAENSNKTWKAIGWGLAKAVGSGVAGFFMG